MPNWPATSWVRLCRAFLGTLRHVLVTLRHPSGATDAPIGHSTDIPCTRPRTYALNELPANLRIVTERRHFRRHRYFRLLEELINDLGGAGVDCSRDQRNDLAELLRKKAKETGNMAYAETALALRFSKGRVSIDVPPERIEIGEYQRFCGNFSNADRALVYVPSLPPGSWTRIYTRLESRKRPKTAGRTSRPCETRT